MKYVHRLVAMAFVKGMVSGKEVNHIDGNKRNNAASNLEWVTKSENQLHAYKIGLRRPTYGNHRKAKTGKN